MNKRVNPLAYGTTVGIVIGLSGALIMGACLAPTPNREPIVEATTQSYTAPEGVEPEEVGAVGAVEYTLIACPEEDSMENCFWDASERGNGEGTDFIVFNGVVFYPGQ